ncbi:MAG TPA: FecR domain-containing protein [Bdellovibrionales bacterium]|nr:FecR domain-containing protein [Bdellovibrionales bacterium]
MDRYLIAGAVLLLSIEVSWLMNDLKIIDVPVFGQAESILPSRPIGRVLSTKQDLRRRPNDSILWEESRPNDTLFVNDTVLTLDQSAATLQLNDQSEISLAENTLIVLEPMENKAQEQLRVRFTRGQLHSRNVASTTVIAAPKWTMQVEKGAEIKLRSVGAGQMEVELLKGKLELQNEGKEKISFDNEQVIMLHQEQAAAIPISETLTWQSGKDNVYRVYSHTFPKVTWLQWKGEATSLRLTKPGGDTSVYPLLRDQNQFPLRLEPGLYQVRVENGTSSSATLAVQVWKAPPFHLLSPLPRDRYTSGTETLFTWSTAGLISKYQFELGRNPEFNDIVMTTASDGSNATVTMPAQGQYFWRVQALDDLGFPIPSLDTNIIFSVKDPLQAPKLKAPETRAPAKDDSASLMKKVIDTIGELLLPTAHAKDETFEAVFGWEEVDGAEHYYIEIALEPDFQNPIVVQKTKTPQYVWTKATIGVYFWRVAAGSEDRMGLFSEAAKVNLNAPTYQAREVAPGVQIRKTAKPKVEKVPPAPVVAVLEKPDPTPTPEPPPPPGSRRIKFKVWYGAGYDYSWLSGGDSSTAIYSGISPLQLGANVEIPSGDWASIWADFTYQQALWKPKSPSETPFQTQLTDNTMRVRLHYRSKPASLHYGLYATSMSRLKRTGLESVSLEPHWLFGPSFGLEWTEFESLQLTHLFSLSAGTQTIEAITTHRAQRAIPIGAGSSLLLGGQMDLLFQRHENGSNFRVQFGVHGGLSW